jgi:hypothetical protein
MISVIKWNGGVALLGVQNVNVLRFMAICLSLGKNCNDFALIFLNLSWAFLSGHRLAIFSLFCSCFCIIVWSYLLSELFDKQRHLAGNFRGF